VELGCERVRSRHRGVKKAVDKVVWHGMAWRAMVAGGLTCYIGTWMGCHVVECAQFGWYSMEGSK